MSTEQVPSTTRDHEDALTVIADAAVFQQVIDQLDTIVNEAVFQLGHDGLQVSVIDPADVAMMRLDVGPSAFEHVGDGKYPFGVDLERLDDYIDNANAGDLVEIAFDPETRKLHIQHTTVNVDMAGIDPESVRKGQNLPQVDWSCSFALEADDLRTAVDHAALASDHTAFVADPDEEEFRVVGEGDLDTIETSFGRDELVDAKFPEEAVSLFSLEYLAGAGGMLKPIPGNAVVEGVLDTEMPIQFDYEFADGNAQASIALAPRISTS